MSFSNFIKINWSLWSIAPVFSMEGGGILKFVVLTVTGGYVGSVFIKHGLPRIYDYLERVKLGPNIMEKEISENKKDILENKNEILELKKELNEAKRKVEQNEEERRRQHAEVKKEVEDTVRQLIELKFKIQSLADMSAVEKQHYLTLIDVLVHKIKNSDTEL